MNINEGKTFVLTDEKLKAIQEGVRDGLYRLGQQSAVWGSKGISRFLASDMLDAMRWVRFGGKITGECFVEMDFIDGRVYVCRCEGMMLEGETEELAQARMAVLAGDIIRRINQMPDGAIRAGVIDPPGKSWFVGRPFETLNKYWSGYRREGVIVGEADAHDDTGTGGKGNGTLPGE